jgi:uncharacterized protein YjbI with pentapeptide repeats
MAKKLNFTWTKPQLEGKTFVLVGKAFRAIQRAGKFVTAEGASIADELSSKVDYIVVPERGREEEVASIRKSTRQLNRKGANIKIITPSEVVGVLELSADDVVTMFQAGKLGIKRFRSFVNTYLALRDGDHPSAFAVDLSGRDLRGLSIPSTNLTFVKLDKADLTGTTLRNSDLPPLHGARVDGADLRDCQLRALKECTFESAKLNHAYFRSGKENKVIEACSFEGAFLTQADGWLRCFKKCSFRSASLRRAKMELADASGCDFTEATLNESNFHEATLAGATLARAKLKKAILSRVNLQGADLTGADLRGAYLVGADLSQCIVDGADFRDANLFAASVEGVDFSKAKHLDSVPQPTGEIGPCTREFVKCVNQAKSAGTSLKVRLPGGETVNLHLYVDKGRASAQIQLDAGKPVVLNTRGRQICSMEPVDRAMMQAVRAVGWGTLVQETIAAKSEAGPVDDRSLTQMAQAAWCEVFGETQVTQADMEKHQQRREKRLQQLQNKLLKSFRKGIRGIDRIDKITHENVHLIHERMEAIREQIRALMSELGDDGVVDFRGVDLQDANLVGVHFFRMDLEGANLSGAFGGEFGHVNLRNANLRRTRIGGAAYADLTGADLRDAQLQDVCLLGATLDGATLAGANLCGADLINIHAEGADWDGATLNAKTRFSPDFELPAGMIWAGPGTDPRTKRQATAKTKKTGASRKRSRKSKQSEDEAEVSLKCLLTDKQLAKACAGFEHDPAFPDGIDSEDLRHPIYGPDLIYSICLEFCPNRFRDLELTRQEYAFNVWYRAERFAQLFDAADNRYSHGDHDRAERLMPAMTVELFEKAYRRIQREVGKIVSD